MKELHETKGMAKTVNPVKLYDKRVTKLPRFWLLKLFPNGVAHNTFLSGEDR
jgi:hypothetical protein